MPYPMAAARGRSSGAVAGGWWLSGGISAANVVAAYQAKGAASQAASYVNLASPGTHDLTVGSAPAWAAGVGWTFDGIANYLVTDIVPQMTYSMFIQYIDYTNADNTHTAIGTYTSAIPMGFLIQGSMLVHVSGFRENTPALTSGNYGVAGKQPYRNGVAEPLAVAAGGSNPTTVINIGRCGGLNTQYAAIKVRAAVIYDATITAPQITELVTAMAAL